MTIQLIIYADINLFMVVAFATSIYELLFPPIMHCASLWSIPTNRILIITVFIITYDTSIYILFHKFIPEMIVLIQCILTGIDGIVVESTLPMVNCFSQMIVMNMGRFPFGLSKGT